MEKIDDIFFFLVYEADVRASDYPYELSAYSSMVLKNRGIISGLSKPETRRHRMAPHSPKMMSKIELTDIEKMFADFTGNVFFFSSKKKKKDEANLKTAEAAMAA